VPQVVVPHPGNAESPSAYCSRADALGLACQPANQGKGPSGAPTNVVYATSPAGGTAVAAGTSVAAEFYSTTTVQETVPSVVGMDVNTACNTLVGTSLTCTKADSGEAPAGTAGGVVTSQSVAAGTTVSAGTAVSVAFYSSLPVPPPGPQQPPADYCQKLNLLGPACSPKDLGQGPTGTTTGIVIATQPAAGTAVTPGTAVAAEFYSSAAPATVTVPNCVGMNYQSCPATAGITWPGNPQSTASAAVNCGIVSQQQPAAGTVVTVGTAVSVTYEPYCAQPFYEYNRPGTQIYYLSLSGTPPTGFNQLPVGGDAYPLSGGGCAKAGTEPVYGFQYNPGQPNAGPFPHHYFTTDGSWNHPGWTPEGPAACVFGGAVPGAEAVYAHYINSPDVPGNYVWSPSGGDSIVWYQPVHA
jgi:beta-lactam-binding protein with PASTA domain